MVVKQITVVITCNSYSSNVTFVSEGKKDIFSKVTPFPHGILWNHPFLGYPFKKFCNESKPIKSSP